MITINDRNIKTWSLIGQRATFGLVCLELVKDNNKLMILTSDVSTSAGLDRLLLQTSGFYFVIFALINKKIIKF